MAKKKTPPKTTTTQPPPLESQSIEKPKKLTAAEKAQIIFAQSPDLSDHTRLEHTLVGDHYNALLPPMQALSNLVGLTNSTATRLTAYLDSVSKVLAPRDGRETVVEPLIVEQQRWAAVMRIQSLTPSVAMLFAARDRLMAEFYEHGPRELEDSPVVFPKPLDEKNWTQVVAKTKGKTALPAPPSSSTHAQKTDPRASAGTGSKKPS